MEEFIDQVGGAADNETKAGDFLSMLVQIIRGTGTNHVAKNSRSNNEANVQADVDASASATGL